MITGILLNLFNTESHITNSETGNMVKPVSYAYSSIFTYFNNTNVKVIWTYFNWHIFKHVEHSILNIVNIDPSQEYIVNTYKLKYINLYHIFFCGL